MGLNDEVTRIENAKAALKTAINAKGGSLTTELIDDYAAAVAALPVHDLSNVTVTASDVLAGKVGIDSSGVEFSGTINTVTPTKSGNVVTIPAGYISSGQTITIGTTQAATTITPGTSDQTIAADTYLAGAVTVLGDAELVSENIAKGKMIFGVPGSHSGGVDELELFDWNTIIKDY